MLYILLTGPSSRDAFNDSAPRPSLTSRLLGKRKASTPVPEQPDTKRQTVESPRQWSSDNNPPATSSPRKISESTDAEPSREAERKEPAQSEQGANISSSDLSGGDVTLANDKPQNVPTQPESEKVITLGDSDSSSEVDICDTPAVVTPKKDTRVIEIPESTKKASPAKARASGGFSTPESVKNHGHRVGRSPLMFTKDPATTPGSSSSAGASPRAESRHTSPLPCHYCPCSGQLSAVKTCLVCGASMCAEHLRPHLDSPVFQNHTLVAPVEDISSWRCLEHQEMNRIFCRPCGVCVCTVCTVIGSHRDHACISIREAERELRVRAERSRPAT